MHVERCKASLVVYRGELYVFGGMTLNPQIVSCFAQHYNESSQKWSRVAYRGFDYPALTCCTPSTSLLTLQMANNILIFGGSNYQQSTYLIQHLEIDKDQFDLNAKDSLLKMRRERAGCTLGLIGKDRVVCFGGLNENEELLDMDVVKVRISEDEVKPIFVYDDISLGSYKYTLRENHKQVYHRLYEVSGVREDKIKNGLKSIDSPENTHYLEKMWYSVGKNYVWVPL